MAKLVYPVVVRQVGSAIGASIPDFRWQVVGASPADAFANAQKAVKKALEDCETHGTPPPAPSVITLAQVEFANYGGPLPISVPRRVVDYERQRDDANPTSPFCSHEQLPPHPKADM